MKHFSKIQKIIDENESFVLSTHVNPDGDALGSELAFYYYLTALKKDVRIINHSPVPETLMFMDADNVIEQYEEEKHYDLIQSVDVLAAIDLNQLGRLFSMEEAFRNSPATKMCIDHHQDPENFTEHMFDYHDASSTGEIIFDLFKATGKVELNEKIALNLYTAIMTDTGSFKYERTTSKIHLIVAELLTYGIIPREIDYLINEQGSLSRLKLLGRAFDSYKIDETGVIGHMTITKKDLEEANAVEADIEGFVNYCMSVKGVQIGLLFFEMENGVKVSFRSIGEIPIRDLAMEFGGGGHFHAAGARIFGGEIIEYKEKVLEAAKKYVKFARK